MRKSQNIDNSTWAYLTFILGLGAIYIVRKDDTLHVGAPNDITLLLNAISEQKDKDNLDELINAAGYSYDPEQDIFYSSLYPWQRRFGYCRLFDEASAVLSMIIDCEPIYFDYDNKRWLVGLWKGQYGMTTGGEIGIYYTDKPNINIPGIYKGPFYRSITDKELLDMSYILYKNDEKLFTREGRHWWLAGFKLAEFSEPKELKMNISIDLKSRGMRDAFIGGLNQAGYSDGDITIDDNAVTFIYGTPKTPQPLTRNTRTDWLIQRKNELLCLLFNLYTLPYNNSMDKLKYMEEQFPELSKLVSILAGSR